MTIDAALLPRLLAHYPALQGLPAVQLERLLAREATLAQVPAGTVLFEEGQPCRGFPMLLGGELRVARGSPEGRAIELYRVVPGEICLVSASCLFGRAAVPAHGVALQDSEILLLSPAAFEHCSGDRGFREFVFGLFADRLSELMSLTEAVAFQRLDRRLAAALLGRGAVVQATHQALADELGTVREIVTRLLKRFERAGWIALGRERIELHQAAALRALAAGEEPRGAV